MLEKFFLVNLDEQGQSKKNNLFLLEGGGVEVKAQPNEDHRELGNSPVSASINYRPSNRTQNTVDKCQF